MSLTWVRGYRFVLKNKGVEQFSEEDNNKNGCFGLVR